MTGGNWWPYAVSIAASCPYIWNSASASARGIRTFGRTPSSTITDGVFGEPRTTFPVAQRSRSCSDRPTQSAPTSCTSSSSSSAYTRTSARRSRALKCLDSSNARRQWGQSRSTTT